MSEREDESGGRTTAASAAASPPEARAGVTGNAEGESGEWPANEQGGEPGDAGGRGPTKVTVDKWPVALSDEDAPSREQEESETEDLGSGKSDADRAKEKEREMEESGEELPA